MKDSEIEIAQDLIEVIKTALPNATWGRIRSFNLTWQEAVDGDRVSAYPNIYIVFDTVGN